VTEKASLFTQIRGWRKNNSGNQKILSQGIGTWLDDVFDYHVNQFEGWNVYCAGMVWSWMCFYPQYIYFFLWVTMTICTNVRNRTRRDVWNELKMLSEGDMDQNGWKELLKNLLFPTTTGLFSAWVNVQGCQNGMFKIVNDPKYKPSKITITF